MPHIVIEYSSDVADKTDMAQLCETAFNVANASGIFGDPATIKVRAIECPYVFMGTQSQSCLHVEIRMLTGRTDAIKAAITTALRDAFVDALPNVPNISVDSTELHDGSYTKR